jgi:hypothetical protein
MHMHLCVAEDCEGEFEHPPQHRRHHLSELGVCKQQLAVLLKQSANAAQEGGDRDALHQEVAQLREDLRQRRMTAAADASSIETQLAAAARAAEDTTEAYAQRVSALEQRLQVSAACLTAHLLCGVPALYPSRERDAACSAGSMLHP